MALFRIKRQNINESALNIDKFDETVQNQISVESIQAVYDSVNLAAPAITSVAYANSSYTVLDDTAANVSGGYIVISGSGFQSGAQITIGSDSATSVTHVNSSTIRAQIPAKDAGSYHLTLINPTGGISILVNGITYSNTPVWGTAGTLDNQAVDTAFAVTLSANSDSNVTYSNTTTLPAGTELLSNGYFYGTISGIESETTYNFTVAAIDEELQDNPREFSVTVTVIPPYSLYVWGNGDQGFLGLNDQLLKNSPILLGASEEWANVSIGYYQTILRKSDGTLWATGANSQGNLGLNDGIAKSSPVQIGSLTNWSDKFSSGAYHTAAIKTDGTLWIWGYNSFGQLGLNDRINRSSPTQVGSGTTYLWDQVSSGLYHTGTIRKDHLTLWLWGFNSYGQLGLSNTVHRSSPVQVGGNSWRITPNTLSCHATRTMAIDASGYMFVSGYNYQGQLGLNTRGNTNKSSPTQVGASNDWASLAKGPNSGQHSFAIKTNGTLWAWGGAGVLGLGNQLHYRSSPVQIGSDTNWNSIVSGQSHAMATKTDGTLWVWGYNDQNQLGLGNSTNVFSPVQLGSDTTWDKNIAAGGSNQSMAFKNA